MPNRIVNNNQKYGALNTLYFDTQKENWVCECECGSKVYRSAYALRHQKYPSCGCKRNIKATLPDCMSLKNSVILAYKTNANVKGLEFSLTDQQVLELISKDCEYCEAKPANKVKTRKRKGRIHRPERDQEFVYNGIDRVDSSIGYKVSNCVPCCVICNISKNDMSLTEWKNWIQRVYSKTFNDYAKAVESSDSKRETPEKSG